MLLILLGYLLKLVLAVSLFGLGLLLVIGSIPSPRRYLLMQKLPGPKGHFYFGNLIELLSVPKEQLIKFLAKNFEGHDRLIAMWFLGRSDVFLRDPKDVQVLLNSIDNLSKGFQYFILLPWLNEGLLTSTGEKWRSRRKVLTPAFHFKILEDNMTIFNKNARKLRDKFAQTQGEEVILDEYLTLCTLDVIMGTAMGIDIDAQTGGKEYVTKLKEVSRLVIHRMLRPHLFIDTLFYLSSTGKQFKKALQYLHQFSDDVIAERKRTFIADSDKKVSSSGKVRWAFLDLMIEYEKKKPGTFQDKDIREEVDTFMFEGHDTTSAALVFIFFCLAKYQDVQEKVYQELCDIFEDSDREATVTDLHQMVYLEKTVKESLRLYPSVPHVARMLEKDLVLSDGLIIPAKTNCNVPIYLLHRNEHYWPDPEKFDPERFSEEQSQGRHPYAYIPFSAGPRNCIGQKFALMELKTVVSTVLRRLKVEPVTREEDLNIVNFLVLRSLVPVKCKFSFR